MTLCVLYLHIRMKSSLCKKNKIANLKNKIDSQKVIRKRNKKTISYYLHSKLVHTYIYIYTCISKYYFICLRLYVIHFYILFHFLTYDFQIVHVVYVYYTSKSITYNFINISNSYVLICNTISVSFKLFTCITLL